MVDLERFGVLFFMRFFCLFFAEISELLQYVRRTNPEMTREKLIEELSKSDYVVRSLIFTKENIVAIGQK